MKAHDMPNKIVYARFVIIAMEVVLVVAQSWQFLSTLWRT